MRSVVPAGIQCIVICYPALKRWAICHEPSSKPLPSIRLPRRPARENFRSTPAATGRRRMVTSLSESLFALSGI